MSAQTMTKSQDVEVPSPNLPQTPDSEAEALTVDAIVYDEVYVPPLEGIESAARKHLRIETDNGTTGAQGDRFIYGNAGGHRLFDDLDGTKRKIEILLSRDAGKTPQIEKHQKEIVSLKGQVGRLVQSSEG